MKITDGTGSGRTAKVNAENKLETHTVTVHNDRHYNIDHNTAFSLPFTGIDPVGADDYFIYLKNTGTNPISITDIRVSSTVAGQIRVRHVSGTPSYTSDTDITPVNRYLGSAKTITMTAKTDTDTTGLTSEGDIFYIDLDTADEGVHLKTSSNIIMPPGQAVALNWDTATGILSGIISVVEIVD